MFPKRDEALKRILLPTFSADVAPLRAFLTRPSFENDSLDERLFIDSCQEIRRYIPIYRWPFSPVYLLHINTYCHSDEISIPAEISLVETTFCPLLYSDTTDFLVETCSPKILEHYQRYLNDEKSFSSITNAFHDFVDPGDPMTLAFESAMLEHSQNIHSLTFTKLREKIANDNYNQLLDHLQTMINKFRQTSSMPIFCTMKSFWPIKFALDWLYSRETTRNRTDNYLLFPFEALIAVIYENFYRQTGFRCDLKVLMEKTPQQPILRSSPCDFHRILKNKHCTAAHVRDLSDYYISLMAYLFYTYCDESSSTNLPYIKTIYQGNILLQQQAFWISQKNRSWLIKHRLLNSCHSSSTEQQRSNKIVIKSKNIIQSTLNPLAAPFEYCKSPSLSATAPINMTEPVV